MPAAVLALALALGFAAPGAEAAAPARKGPVAQTYLAFDVMTVSVMEHRRIQGLLILEITLHVPEHDAQLKALALKPRLHDAFIRQLLDYGSKIAVIDRPPDLAAITARLQREVDQRLPGAGAKVLLTQVLVRPIG